MKQSNNRTIEQSNNRATEQPFFSIIIPTLNEEKYLPTVLQDLADQSFRNFEVLVVDAESGDRTIEVASKFAKVLPSLKILTCKKRLVQHQRNLGAKKATGKYYVFFDADVSIPSDFLESVYSEIVSAHCKFLTTWVEPDSQNSADQILIDMTNIAIELANVVGKPFVAGFDIVIHRGVFDKVGGFREDLTIAEDHDLAERVRKAGYGLTIIKEPRLIASLRRLRSEGTLEVLRKYAKVNLHLFLKGPITYKLVDYPMGGHVHYGKEKRKKAKKLIELNKYIKRLERVQRKFVEVLME